MPDKNDPGAQRLRAKTTRQRWTLVVLGTTCVACIGWRLVSTGSPAASRASASPTPDAVAPAVAADLRVVIAHEPEGVVELERCLFEMPPANDLQLDIPEVPAPEAAEPVVDADAVRRDAADRLELRGVICGRDSAAQINGRFLREGETVEGFCVLRISPGLVVLERDGVLVYLEL